jgi:hypothetical protein
VNPEPGVSAKASTGTPPGKLCGIFVYKARWGLSRAAWLALAVVALLAAVLFVVSAHSFLALTAPVDSSVLVVEGWIHDYAIAAAAQEFKQRGYQQVYTTGGPTPGSGGYINDFNTMASVGAELIKKAGVPKESVQSVPAHVLGRDRTFSSAVALRDWLLEHRVEVRSFNILTEDAHARRSRLLFQRAFGPGVKVGVISVACPDYDASHWWRYSEGVREVLGESIGYVYARICFW